MLHFIHKYKRDDFVRNTAKQSSSSDMTVVLTVSSCTRLAKHYSYISLVSFRRVISGIVVSKAVKASATIEVSRFNESVMIKFQVNGAVNRASYLCCTISRFRKISQKLSQTFSLKNVR